MPDWDSLSGHDLDRALAPYAGWTDIKESWSSADNPEPPSPRPWRARSERRTNAGRLLPKDDPLPPSSTVTKFGTAVWAKETD